MNETSDAGSLIVDYQLAVGNDPSGIPLEGSVSGWAQTAFQSTSNRRHNSAEITIRVVSEVEMTELNEAYRGKQGSTNVLSFPFESDLGLHLSDAITVDKDEEMSDLPILGDVVVCHDVVRREASEQSKQLEHHYAHMIVHGVLHLCGHDHQNVEQALEMETLETEILGSMGFENPYS